MPHLADRSLRPLLIGFVLAAVCVTARLMTLEASLGPQLRAQAAQPIAKHRVLPAGRGRILARDGTVLAVDRPTVSLSIDYRRLEQPASPQWLRAMARARLSPRERRNPESLRRAEDDVLQQREATAQQLQALCGIDADEWKTRAAAIQRRVERIAQRANASRNESLPADREQADWLSSAATRLFDALLRPTIDPPQPVIVAEELTDHVMCDSLSLEAVADIEGHPDRYPGAHVVYGMRRDYPTPALAPHVVGYTSRQSAAGPTAAQSIGRAGVEARYETVLRGRDGLAIDRLDARGRLLATSMEEEPAAGQDLTLTIDPVLQAAAEKLLDTALKRRTGQASTLATTGGAILALDVHTGAVLAAASAPRFDDGAMSGGDADVVGRLLNDPAHPLVDRTIQMALPPGSSFKALTSLALLARADFDPQRPIDCQGYLHTPDARRCMLFRRTGVGHGPMTLADALAQSCNVYFFSYAEQMGLEPIEDWARRCGFGQLSGIDLPSEAAGRLPAAAATAAGPEQQRQRTARKSLDEALSLAIGQGQLTVTPMQMARLMAAIAGGAIVTPHVMLDGAAAAKPIEGLDPRTLAVIRQGLERVVSDDEGTAHATVALDWIAIAGKTGTAEVGGGKPDHAWFAGYAPAESPRVAFVVAIEHGGEAAVATGPVVRRLVEKLAACGYLGRR